MLKILLTMIKNKDSDVAPLLVLLLLSAVSVGLVIISVIQIINIYQGD